MSAPTSIRPGKLHPFTGQDIPWLLEARAAAHPDKVFLIAAPFDREAESWTYGRFHGAVTRLAGGLAARGVRKGDFVLLHMGNCAEFLLAWHACAWLGAIVVTTNIRSARDELAYYAANCGARFAITQPAFEPLLREAASGIEQIAVIAHDPGETAAAPRSDAAIRFESLLEGTPVSRRPPEPMAFGSVQYTSGTTARPKGVVWTHANALWGARTNAIACGIGPDDIGHSCLPLFHTNALCYSHLATLWAGATLVVQPRFSATRYWPCLVEHGCTWGVQIPFMLKALFGQPIPARHSVTRWGLGAFNPGIVIETFGIPCIGWFGMTETVGLPLVTVTGLPGREMSMGTVAPGYEVEVRSEDGGLAGFGESGMLWLRGIAGLSLFAEYLNNPEATAASFDSEGWFETGDRVTAFADGHVRFEGRERDMLRVGAENVAEAEIERVLMGAGGVVEVAVVGKPDPMLDEVPVAFVLPIDPGSDPSEHLLASCRAQLADFKVPRVIHVVDDFPRVTLGKIDKKLLRARLKAETGEKEG